MTEDCLKGQITLVNVQNFEEYVTTNELTNSLNKKFVVISEDEYNSIDPDADTFYFIKK